MVSASSAENPGFTPDFDAATKENVRRIAIGLYDFLAATRRLGERPNQRLDISQSEMEVLHFISTHPGCGVSDIARLRFLRPSNVSATVRRLLDNNLIKREHNAVDRRAQDLYVSDTGTELLEQMIGHWGEIIERIVLTMSPDDVRRLAKAVQPLLQLAEHSETFVEEHQRRHETFSAPPGFRESKTRSPNPLAQIL